MAEIPEPLIDLFRERRVIPFVGSGMSANLDFPDWDSLLANIFSDDSLRGRGNEAQTLTFDEIMKYAGRDRLRVAEYFYLLAGKQMGLIRRVIEHSFNDQSPSGYGGYADLVNLGAPLVYTTNFDDLIEKAHRRLGIDVQTIVTARDIALSRGQRPQIVKYHGDLADDKSLVLTESSYYRRLNFESPLDLKFRADLLGRSVLFIGYSFNDPNVRVIWFRLLDMMQDVDQKDMPKSYIVTVQANPVQEMLYRDAGIDPIVLDPLGKATEQDFGRLLADFLLDLSMVVASETIPGTTQAPFASRTLLARISDQLTRTRLGGRRFGFPTRTEIHEVRRLAQSAIPDDTLSEAIALFDLEMSPSVSSTQLALRLTREHGAIPGLVAHLLEASVNQWFDQSQLELPDFDYSTIDIGSKSRERLMNRLQSEISYHEHGFDGDVFLAARAVLPISDGHLGATPDDQVQAAAHLSALEERYEGVVSAIRTSRVANLADVVEQFRPDEEEETEDDQFF